MKDLRARAGRFGSTSENKEIDMAAKKKQKQAAANGKPVKVKKKKTSRGK